MPKRAVRTIATPQAGPGPAPALPRSLLFDRDYWLMRCEGFSVKVDGRTAGSVEELRFASRLDRPDLLVVRGRPPSRRRVLVSAADVEEIDPRQRRIVARRLAQEPSQPSGPLRRILAHLRNG
jgi:hypothetical protein